MTVTVIHRGQICVLGNAWDWGINYFLLFNSVNLRNHFFSGIRVIWLFFFFSFCNGNQYHLLLKTVSKRPFVCAIDAGPKRFLQLNLSVVQIMPAKLALSLVSFVRVVLKCLCEKDFVCCWRTGTLFLILDGGVSGLCRELGVMRCGFALPGAMPWFPLPNFSGPLTRARVLALLLTVLAN